MLLVRFSSLGDVVLATAAATRLRQARPETAVVCVTRAVWMPVLFHHPDIQRVIALDPPAGEGDGLLGLAARLRRETWDGIVDLHGSLRSRILGWLVPAGRRVIYDGHKLRRRILVAAPGLARPTGAKSPFRVVDAYIDAVDRYLGAAAPALSRPMPAVHLARAEVNWALGEMERIGLTRGSVGLCPGARHATKRWPVEYYAETLDRLAVRGQAVVPVFLSSSSADQAVESALRRAVRRPEALRVVRQPIRRAAALMGLCRAVVTNDSGLMHLAAAVGTPVVALFGPTVPEFGFGPAGPGHRVLERPLSCRPCSLHGGPACPRRHFRCLREIPPEEVLVALERIQGNPSRT